MLANVTLNSVICSFCGASASERDGHFHSLVVLVPGHSYYGQMSLFKSATGG